MGVRKKWTDFDQLEHTQEVIWAVERLWDAVFAEAKKGNVQRGELYSLINQLNNHEFKYLRLRREMGAKDYLAIGVDMSDEQNKSMNEWRLTALRMVKELIAMS